MSESDPQPLWLVLWQTIVVPTAQGIVALFWGLAWFAVITIILFGSYLIHFASTHGADHEDRNAPFVRDQAVRAEPAPQR